MTSVQSRNPIWLEAGIILDTFMMPMYDRRTTCILTLTATSLTIQIFPMGTCSSHTSVHIFQIWLVFFIQALCIQDTAKYANLPELSGVWVNKCIFWGGEGGDGKYYWPQLRWALLYFSPPLKSQRTEQHVARKSCIQREAMKTSACRVTKMEVKLFHNRAQNSFYENSALYVWNCNLYPCITVLKIPEVQWGHISKESTDTQVWVVHLTKLTCHCHAETNTIHTSYEWVCLN